MSGMLAACLPGCLPRILQASTARRGSRTLPVWPSRFPAIVGPISHKGPAEHHDDAHHDAAPREPDGDPAENPVRTTLATQKATAEPAEEAGYLSPARYLPAIVGEPRLKAFFVVVFV